MLEIIRQKMHYETIKVKESMTVLIEKTYISMNDCDVSFMG